MDNGGLPITAFAVQYKLAGQVWDEKPLQRVWVVGGNEYYDMHDSIAHANTGLFLFLFLLHLFINFVWFFFIDFDVFYFPFIRFNFLLLRLFVESLLFEKKKNDFTTPTHHIFSLAQPPVCVCNLVSISHSSLLPRCVRLSRQ